MLSEKAKSRAQQRFFGMVRAAQKGEMDNPSSEVLDAADSMKVDDVKKFAKTKHKGLPEKKKIKESFTPHKMIDPSTKKEYWADTYDKHLKYKKMGYVHEEKKPRNCGCGKDPCITYGKKKIEEVAFLAGLAKGAMVAAKGAVKQKAKQAIKQKAANVAAGVIPQPNRDQQNESKGTAELAAIKLRGKKACAVCGSLTHATGQCPKKEHDVNEGVGRVIGSVAGTVAKAAKAVNREVLPIKHAKNLEQEVKKGYEASKPKEVKKKINKKRNILQKGIGKVARAVSSKTDKIASTMGEDTAPPKVKLKDTGNPIQNAWNKFVPPPESSNNPNVRSGKLKPGKLEAPLLNKMNKTAANINKPIKAASRIAKVAVPVAAGLAVSKGVDSLMKMGTKKKIKEQILDELNLDELKLFGKKGSGAIFYNDPKGRREALKTTGTDPGSGLKKAVTNTVTNKVKSVGNTVQKSIDTQTNRAGSNIGNQISRKVKPAVSQGVSDGIKQGATAVGKAALKGTAAVGAGLAVSKGVDSVMKGGKKKTNEELSIVDKMLIEYSPKVVLEKKKQPSVHDDYYDPMEDPYFDPHEAEATRGQSGKGTKGKMNVRKKYPVKEGVVDVIKKGTKRHKDAVEKKKIKNRKAVPYAALAAEHEPEGEELKEYSPNVTYQAKGGKKSGKLGKSSVYSLRDKDESKKEFRKSQVKDIKGGYLKTEEKKKGLDGKECWDGYKLAGTKKKGGKTVDNCVKVKEDYYSGTGEKVQKRTLAWMKKKGQKGAPGLDAMKAREAEHKAKRGVKEEVVDEAKVEKNRSDYGKASVRNKRKFGKEGEPAIFDTNSERGKMIDQRRAEHKARRGVKEDWKPEIEHSKLGDAKKKADKKRESKLPPHLQGDAIGKMKKAFSQEGYRVLASSDGQEKPSQFSYKDEKTAKKYVDSIKKGGGKATIVKEDIGSFKDYMANVEAAKKRQKDKEENRKRKSDAYIERVRKGIKFYDAKGSGRMVKGKKVYDKK